MVRLKKWNWSLYSWVLIENISVNSRGILSLKKKKGFEGLPNSALWKDLEIMTSPVVRVPWVPKLWSLNIFYFPLRWNPGFLKKWLIPDLEQEIYRINLNFLVGSKNKKHCPDHFQRTHGSTRKDSHHPKVRQLEHQ